MEDREGQREVQIAHLAVCTLISRACLPPSLRSRLPEALAQASSQPQKFAEVEEAELRG